MNKKKVNKEKLEKMKEKMRCTPACIKIGNSETPGYVCLVGESENVSVNVVSKEELKKAAKKAIEKEE